MSIDLSSLTGADQDNLDLIRGKLPPMAQDFEGPFQGFARLARSGAATFNLHGQWIESIQLTPQSANLQLKLPVPLDFRGVDFLVLYFTYNAATDTWKVGFGPMAWLDLKGGDKVEGDPEGWMVNSRTRELPLVKMNGTSGFPLDAWGLAKAPMKWTRQADHSLGAGIFQDGKGRPLLVIAPQSQTDSKLDPASPGLNFVGMGDQALGAETSKIGLAPLALAFPLHADPGVAVWQGLVNWAPLQRVQDRDDDKRLAFAPIIDTLWNIPVGRALQGVRLENSAHPVVPLPLLTIAETPGDSRQQQSPMLFVDVPRDGITRAPGGPRLRHVFLAGDKDAIALKAQFHLHARATSISELEPHIPMIEFTGTVDTPLPHVSTDVSGSGSAPERLRSALVEALDRREKGASDDLLMAFVATGKVKAPGSADGWVVWGSLQFQVPDADNASQQLQCLVRGSWSTSECDAYPESILDLYGCHVRPSANADAADRDLFAAFGAQSGLEDALQRDSDVLRFARRAEQGSRSCHVRIRHRTDLGRVAVSRVEIYATDRGPFGAESVVLQMRPFAVAVVSPAEIDAEAGELIAVWSSNDPEGVQWRLPDATAKVTLPPQAVGEAMERGARFWQPLAPGKPWIDPENPVAYRFSPPTHLVVRPSVRERRYNKSPANFSALLADAKVDAFTTETLYPVQAKFAVSPLGLPEIRVRETGSMLGRPAANLAPPIDVQDGVNDSRAIERWFRYIFASEVATYAADSPARKSVASDVIDIRQRQAAVKASFAARLAQYHVYNPWAADGRLALAEGLSFRLRDTRYGARPLLNPLPQWKLAKESQELIPDVDLLARQKEAIHVDNEASGPQFLKKDRTWADPAAPDGAFVGGVIHTMEFPSELVAVLRNPVGVKGVIDQLAFTSLGANAHMALAFDEGRTIFVGETNYGQLSRLIKIRIGRVAVLWNRARHVIVYERTTVPSQQFEGEQEIGGNVSRGWPILRKTEEYVEPLEPLRVFADEAQVKDNRAGFIHASEFISPRVYVNGAWGRDLGHGYEIPLWNLNDDSGFYPKPKLAVRAHAGGAELSRCMHDEPHELYFYSNTEPGRGDNSDTWPSFRGIDQPLSTPRLKVVTTVPGGLPEGAARQNKIMDTARLPAPRLGGLRRPRFDFKVVCEGKVNLQHARGETEMLGVMDIVTVMRTAAADAGAEWLEGVPEDKRDATWETQLAQIKAVSNLASEVASAQALRAKAQVFVEQACERIASGSACEQIKAQLKSQLHQLFVDTRNDLHDSMGRLPAPPVPTGLLTRAVDELERELLGVERAIRAPFDKLLVDLAALRANAQGDAAQAHRRAIGQLDCDAEIARTVLDGAQKSVAAWKARLDGTVASAQGSVVAILTEARKDVAELAKMADFPFKLLDGPATIKICDRTLLKLRALEPHKVYGKVLGRCADAIAAVRASIADGLVERFWNDSHAALKLAAQKLGDLLGQFITVATAAAGQAQAILDDLARIVTSISTTLDGAIKLLRDEGAGKLDASLQSITGMIEKIHANADTTVISERDDILRKWRFDIVRTQVDVLRLSAGELEKDVVTAFTPVLDYAKLTAKLLKELEGDADNWLVRIETEFMTLIDGFDCAQFDALRAKLQEQLKAIETQVRDRITGLATSIIDDSTRANFGELENAIRDKVKDVQAVADDVAKGVKLVKALGELPQLPTLTFNADRAEYVFDDFRQQIETSPFAVKLREIDTGLKELGLSVPTQKLLDQLVPNNLKDVDFSKVFRNFGAMDFTDFFKRFRLPEVRKEELQITHGLDKRTRTAWVNAKVDTHFDEEKELFEFAGIAVTLAKMDMKATSNMTVGLSGEHSSKTEAKLKADWGLAFGGSRLATFRDVQVRYDGSGFDFDIEPKKVELHPALKFVDEFAKRFQPKLPPAIELVKDSRGIPVGVKAQMRTEVVLPPLGIVEIGPMLIRSGLSMRMSPLGKFIVDASVSVGSRDTPVWVQMSYLGGGMWLEARANYDDGVHYEASVGLALGCIKAFNLASVARGSFSFLLFAYATMSERAGGALRAGLQVAGSARIVGIANASVLLLLEAIHEGGKSEGHGTLDVSIDICWCYTLHVRKDVNHQIT